MPHFSAHFVEETLTPEIEASLIHGLTEAVVKVYGEAARPLVVVEIVGTPRRRWGFGGHQPDHPAPVVELSMRESGLVRGDMQDAPGALITAITDAVGDVFGEEARRHATVGVSGTLPGRSGTGGEVF
ncbi:MAG: hypothetical protein JWR83_555 [Aeromicrobium sp.]|nr:hypothetical protein [Aeromicrobium sp.]